MAQRFIALFVANLSNVSALAQMTSLTACGMTLGITASGMPVLSQRESKTHASVYNRLRCILSYGKYLERELRLRTASCRNFRACAHVRHNQRVSVSLHVCVYRQINCRKNYTCLP